MSWDCPACDAAVDRADWPHECPKPRPRCDNPADRALCGPWICHYPKPAQVARGTRWTCPRCNTEYRLTGRKRQLPWRNWSAPHGCWALARSWRHAVRR